MGSSTEIAAAARLAAEPSSSPTAATVIHVVSVSAIASAVQSILPGASNLAGVWITIKPTCDITLMLGTTAGMAAPVSGAEQIFFANQAEDVLVRAAWRFFRVIAAPGATTGTLYWHVSQP